MPHRLNPIALTRLALAALLGGTLLLAPSSATAAVDSTLQARGDGFGNLFVQGSVYLTGGGVLWVKDLRGDMEITVDGHGRTREFDDGWTEYVGFDGTASIAGSGFHVAFGAANVTLDAAGHGRVQLRGKGSCQVNGNPCRWGGPDVEAATAF